MGMWRLGRLFVSTAGLNEVVSRLTMDAKLGIIHT